MGRDDVMRNDLGRIQLGVSDKTAADHHICTVPATYNSQAIHSSHSECH